MAEGSVYDEVPSITADYFCMGYQHYKSVKSEGFYLHVVENYPGTNPDQVGSFSTSLRAPYSEREKLTSLSVPPSASNPVRLTLKGHMSVFQGNNSFAVDEIVKVVQPKKVAAAIPPKAS